MLKNPPLMRQRLGFHLDNVIENRFAGLNHAAENRLDPCRGIRNDFADRPAQMIFHRETVERGEPFIDVLVAEISIEKAQADWSIPVNVLQQDFVLFDFHGQSVVFDQSARIESLNMVGVG